MRKIPRLGALGMPAKESEGLSQHERSGFSAQQDVAPKKDADMPGGNAMLDTQGGGYVEAVTRRPWGARHR